MICKQCNVDKPESDFYKNDKTCKECRKARVRANRAEKAEYYRQYDKKRFKEDPRVRERHKKYQQTEQGKAASDKAKAKWKEKNKIKRAVHVITGNAIRSGILQKMPCEQCGSTVRIHAHHDDYLKPLNVRWLCAAHHKQWHDENGEGLNAK
jgi:hypothetical protein